MPGTPSRVDSHAAASCSRVFGSGSTFGAKPRPFRQNLIPNRRMYTVKHHASANGTAATKGIGFTQQEAGDWFFTETGQKVWVRTAFNAIE